MLGTRLGSAVGTLLGSAVGSSADDEGAGGTNPFAGVTRDATSNVYVPATSAEWTTFIAAAALSIAVPDALWLCQDPSGSLLDAIGAFPLAASGTGLSYQNAVAGWSRKAVNFTEAGSGAFTSTSTSLPDLATSSILTLILAQVTGPSGSTRQMLLQGGAGTNSTMGVVNVSNVIQVTSVANSASGSTVATGAVRPFGLRQNRTAGSTTGFTDANKVIPAFGSTLAGKRCIIGAGTTPTMSVLYACQWHLANAEMTDATFKALLVAMGLTITWT